MRKTFLSVILIFLLASSLAAQPSAPVKYRLGFQYGLGNLRAVTEPYYSFNHNWGVTAGFGRRLTLSFSFLSQKNYASNTADDWMTFFSEKSKAPLAFKSMRVGLDLDYRLRKDGTVRPMIGFGLGYLVWKVVDPKADTVIKVAGDRNQRVDYKASELYLTESIGLEIGLSKHLVCAVKTSLEYLTGLGANFADSTNKKRGQVLARTGLTLSYLFGGEKKREPIASRWASDKSWKENSTIPRPLVGGSDADGDGVINIFDRCPETPAGAIVDSFGCTMDTDGDGVVDGIDDCPQTPKEASGYVDIFGCPVDGDADGIPDYRDSCRQGPIGAVVDTLGCPIDSDGDGVPDGLDDCPGTAPDIPVDQRGCMDVSFLRDTLRINIDYKPGSFEIDERTKKRLQPLVEKLLILKDVKFQIVSYTDNVGLPEANQVLSQKRANRMRDWLVSMGVAAERMTAIGKGETNYIASNDTAEGRAKNRRLEIIFKY